MGPRLSKRLMLIFLAAVVVGAGGYSIWHVATGKQLVFTESIGCGGLEIEVTGRLVHAETGASLEGVTVRALHVGASDTTADGLEELADFQGIVMNDDHQIDGSRSWSTTSVDGAFRLRVWVPWSWTYRNGVLQGEEHPPARTGLAALLLRRPGEEHQLVPVSSAVGTWQEYPEGKEPLADSPRPLWARWDLGHVRVAPRH